MKRFDDTKRASIFGIIGNIFLFCITFGLQIYTKSRIIQWKYCECEVRKSSAKRYRVFPDG